MRVPKATALALLAALSLPVGHALANTCEAGRLTCATTMPVGGYCQCAVHGQAQDGTVVQRAARHRTPNATAGGCGSQPNAPGCR